MSKSKKWSFYSFLILGSALTMIGCSSYTMYVANSNSDTKPAMSLPDAYRNIKIDLQSANASGAQTVKDIQVTEQGFSFINADYNDKQALSIPYRDIQKLYIKGDQGDFHYIYWITNSGTERFVLGLKSYSTAQNLVDAVMAMKYYVSTGALDDTQAFADFQEKAKAWAALPQKPAIPEEARRFRVLADDAVASKDFDKAAKYYEQGLAVEPIWPAGQFNAAMIYKELEFYPMAIMHMKRYLELKPEDTTKYRDEMYIWEEKSKDQAGVAADSNAPSEPTPQRGK